MPANTKKRVTINDIATMAGISKTTVSFYLNGKTERMSSKTQERIREAIAKTGYEPSPIARGMNAKKTSLIGVITGDITNTCSNQIGKGIAQVIEAAGKQLVFFDSKFYDFASSWVKTDNYEATFRAVTECARKGYERFLLVAATPQLLSSRIERTSGFVDALEASEVGFTQFEIENDQVDVPKLQEFLRSNIDGTTPTLVFAPNCWALPDVYVAMREFYPMMPDKVGLLGFDNAEWVGVASPSVSVVMQPALEEGRQACRLLLDLIAGDATVDPHQVLSCDVQWGATTL